MRQLAWVIGARGLLGRAITRQIDGRSQWERFAADPIPWGSAQAATAQARKTAAALFDEAAATGCRWTILWVAGAGVVASSAEKLDAEFAQFRDIFDAIGEESQAAGAASNGTVFFASSAGGVYGGSPNPPHTELTPPVAISPYGQVKLRMEEAVAQFSGQYGVSVLTGRIANLYGPGQQLGKVQGLISHLALAQFSPRPASIFVPLETVRDYIFVDDCAELICDAMDKLASVTQSDGRTEVTKILGSGVGVTIATLLGYFRALSKGHPNIVLGSSRLSSLQAVDLRLQSVVWSDLDARELTPLPAGINATMLDILTHVQQPRSLG
ncbi:NAD-dependent epimerase/dehydratase family protein [Diaminobutyricimonas sp. LJ205]|uniref:NAD-dependent epimerase/dehydratase family protein n=1 Tax=Diaminobutyricimonas sp. LJ205 TaxID=2683590 RepID=UPI0012F48612|nr:NAD-dependent epimerase/dehydratase family protein [Diaminobutyricimonas sp. LJ205]